MKTNYKKRNKDIFYMGSESDIEKIIRAQELNDSEFASPHSPSTLESEATEDPEGDMRLQVYISHSGLCSRRHAAEIIKDGLVMVNKNVVTVPGYRVDSLRDKVFVQGKLCTIQKTHVYFMMNKPRKVESTNFTSHDDEEREPRRTVKDIISRYYDGHIYSVGRLDYHSSGLLLFTTDGTLCNMLTHPKYMVSKKYILETKNEFNDGMLENWHKGLVINGEKYTLDKFYKDKKYPLRLELTLREGKNREIRKVCEYYHVLIEKLHRISCGPVTIDKLPTGKVRPLHKKEVEMLYKAVKKPSSR